MPPDPPQFDSWRDDLETRLTLLPDKPHETADTTLRALWLLATGTPVSAEAALHRCLPVLDRDAEVRLAALVARRAAGEPLAYLTGREQFMGIEMLAGPGALVPRRETELLARAVLQARSASRVTGRRPVLVDVCTGSGNLALALAYHMPNATVFASDLSEDAIALATENARHLRLSDRVDLRVGDLLAPFDEPGFWGTVDVVVCNPPYISTPKLDTLPDESRLFEPRMAFDGGPFGLRLLQRLAHHAPRFLVEGGFLAFEVGAGQGPGMLKWMASHTEFRASRAIADAAGQVRAIVATR